MKKVGGISQFSILRPLSELLILNILVKRYSPDLQQHQVSATLPMRWMAGYIFAGMRADARRHANGSQIFDPHHCGYGEKEIAAAEKLGNQQGETAVAKMVRSFYLLSQKGVLDNAGKSPPRNHAPPFRQRAQPV
ncbi:MAG: hypothetical protein R2788_19100 [Saprospiraceae bacterium]